MKKLFASVLCIALTMTAAPINLLAAGRAIAQTSGSISGIATVDGKPLANVTVRLRNVDTGRLVGNISADGQGQFSFSGLGPGYFVVETVARNGTILGTSPVVVLTAARLVVGAVTVGTSAAAVAAANGDDDRRPAVAGVFAGTRLSATVLTVIAVGASLGATGLIVANNDASPLR